MTDLNSTDYYEARERRERELAAAAADPAIAAIHTEMATRYTGLIEAAATDGRARQGR